MAWDIDLVVMTRALIGDMDPVNQIYTNERIETAIVTGAIYAVQEFDFANSYVFDLETPDITPDPTESATYELEAVALFPLKAACMLSLNAYQTAIGNGIRVRDGDSEVDTTGSFKGYLDILKLGPCGAYDKMLNSLSTRSIGLSGRAVMSPVNVRGFYSNDNFCIDRFYNSLF